MMQLHVSARLVRDPQSKTSAAGKPYLSAMAAVGAGDKEALVTLMVFDADLQTLLASLRKGDGVSATGSGSAAAYLNKEGAPQANITVMANRLMAMTDRQAAPRPRTERRPAERQQDRQADERQYQPADRVSLRPTSRSKIPCPLSEVTMPESSGPGVKKPILNDTAFTNLATTIGGR